jgi:hypothetical protein
MLHLHSPILKKGSEHECPRISRQQPLSQQHSSFSFFLFQFTQYRPSILRSKILTDTFQDIWEPWLRRAYKICQPVPLNWNTNTKPNPQTLCLKEFLRERIEFQTSLTRKTNIHASVQKIDERGHTLIEEDTHQHSRLYLRFFRCWWLSLTISITSRVNPSALRISLLPQNDYHPHLS